MSNYRKFIAAQTPQGWTTKPLWSLFRRRKRTGFAEEELLSVYRDFGVIPKSSRDDNHNKESEDLSGYQLVTEGSLVTNKMKAWQGSIAISRYRGIVSPAYYVYEPLSKEHDQFLHYLLRSEPYIALYGRISKGVRVNQWDLEHEALRNVPVMLPDRETQKSIADFLDRETARVDQLIDKKQRFVSLVSSRFDTEVRLAVTQGLSGADLKPSGVNYLNDVPHHWSVEKVGWRYSIQLGKMLDGAKQTGEHLAPYLRVADVQWDEVLTDELPMMDFSPADRRKFELRPGDLLVNEGGSYVGRSAIWKGKLDECFYQKALHRVRPRNPSRDTADFFLWVMWFATKSGVFVANGNQTTIDHLTAEAFRRYHFAFPPIEEQRCIASNLRTKRTRDMALSGAVVKSIERLRDFKAALITSAVTGQIDIADWRKRDEGARQIDRIQEAMRA